MLIFRADQLTPELKATLQAILVFLYIEDDTDLQVPVDGGILTVSLQKDGS